MTSPIAAIARNPDEGTAIREALGLIPRDRLPFRGRTVVLVPNWVKALPPETGTVVGTGSLRVVIEELLAHDPARLVVAAGSGANETAETLRSIGFDRVIAETGVEFVDLNHGPFTTIELKGRGSFAGRKLEVNRLYEDMDALVVFTMIKVHEEAVVSLSLKCATLSWPPAEIHGLPKIQRGIHEDLHAFIAAMAQAFPIDLAILSGCPAMIGTGPTGGRPVETGIVVAGTDAVSVDVIGTRLLGFRPQAVSYLNTAISEGVGEGDLRAVDLRGMRLDEAEAAFTEAAYGMRIVLDKGKILPVHLGGR